MGHAQGIADGAQAAVPTATAEALSPAADRSGPAVPVAGRPRHRALSHRHEVPGAAGARPGHAAPSHARCASW